MTVNDYIDVKQIAAISVGVLRYRIGQKPFKLIGDGEVYLVRKSTAAISTASPRNLIPPAGVIPGDPAEFVAGAARDRSGLTPKRRNSTILKSGWFRHSVMGVRNDA